jgi:hypothetical protein
MGKKQQGGDTDTTAHQANRRPGPHGKATTQRAEEIKMLILFHTGKKLRAPPDDLKENLNPPVTEHPIDGKRATQERVMAVADPNHDELPGCGGTGNVGRLYREKIQVGGTLLFMKKPALLLKRNHSDSGICVLTSLPRERQTAV